MVSVSSQLDESADQVGIGMWIGFDKMMDQEVFCDLSSCYLGFFSIVDLLASADDTFQPVDYDEAFEIETNAFDFD